MICIWERSLGTSLYQGCWMKTKKTVCRELLQHAETKQTSLTTSLQVTNRGFLDLIQKLNSSCPNKSIHHCSNPRKLGKFGSIKRQYWFLWLWRNYSSWIYCSWSNHPSLFDLDVLKWLRDAVKRKRSTKWHTNSWFLQHDYVPAHTAVSVCATVSG